MKQLDLEVNSDPSGETKARTPQPRSGERMQPTAQPVGGSFAACAGTDASCDLGHGVPWNFAVEGSRQNVLQWRASGKLKGYFLLLRT
jgi:hypothetical protein